MAELDAIVFVPSDEMRMPPITTSANTTKTAGTVVITTIPTKQQDDNQAICHSPGGVRIITTPRNSGTSSKEEREGCDTNTDNMSSHDVSIECCSIDSTDQQESSYTSTIELDQQCLTPKRGLLFRKKKNKYQPNETPATPATDSESVSSSSENNQQLNGEEPTKSIDASDSNSLSPLGDIVTYQEWHPARRQPLSFRYNPSSVCGLSVETIATKVGRSPVVVSFDKSSPINIEGPAFPMADDDIPLHRVPTGRFAAHSGSNLDDDGVVDESYSKSPGTTTEQGCSDYGLSVIESTLASMMCNGNCRSNSCSSSD